MPSDFEFWDVHIISHQREWGDGKMTQNDTRDEMIFQLYIYFQKAAYTFANSTVQKTSKMSVIIDTVYHKAALALPNVGVQH